MRQRLDTELVSRGLTSSRAAAQREIRAGTVSVDGTVVEKPARLVSADQTVEVALAGPTFVSRAGHKLDGALTSFGIDVVGLRCVDAGSSTGGFTDCLLQRGAAEVVAVDVGTDQLHRRLRTDPRVEVRERTDVRDLSAGDLGGAFDLAVVDLSFISLRLILGPLRALLRPGAAALALVKPQFEAGRAVASKGRGVIRDPTVWRSALEGVLAEAEDRGFSLREATVSPITGASGNVEFMVWLTVGGPRRGSDDRRLTSVVETVVAEIEAGSS